MTINTKTLVTVAFLIALSFAGSHLRIFGTIAFDSLPGFLAALMLGPAYGALVGFLGHLFTAFGAGFPLSVPLHLTIAVSMALTMFVYGHTYKALQTRFSQTTAFVATGVVGVLLNAPVSLALSMSVMWLMAGREAAMGLLVLLPALAAASAANIVLRITVFKSLAKVLSRAV